MERDGLGYQYGMNSVSGAGMDSAKGTKRFWYGTDLPSGMEWIRLAVRKGFG